MNKIRITFEIKEIIEENPVAIATITPQNSPNVIGVAFVKVINNNQLLVTDNFMSQTIKDIKNNPKVVVIGWNKEMTGYKLLGKTKYFNSGKWVEKVKLMPENKGMPAKGAILITINRIIKSQ